MKKILFVLFAVALVVPGIINAQKVVRGTGKIAHGEFDISLEYYELSVARGIKVVLTDSNAGVGQIRADEAVIKHVSIIERDGKVKVTYTPSMVNFRTDIETVVTMPVSRNLHDLNVSSAGEIESKVVIKANEVDIDGSSAGHIMVSVEAHELSVDLSSAASCVVKAECYDTDVDLSSAAECQMIGKSTVLDVETSSAAQFDGYELSSERVSARASSGSSIEVFAVADIDASASSGGSIKYKGSPTQTDISRSSGGSVRNVD